MKATIDQFGCVGNTIRVATGYVDLVNPDPSTIDLASIARGLGNECRFGSQTPRYYSVAEHSLHCERLVSAWLPDTSAADQFAVLMHDAAEAYLKDIPKPLKIALGESYEVLESRMEAAIAAAFGLPRDYASWPIVKRCDRMMLVAEKHEFWPEDETDWDGFAAAEPASPVMFEYLSPSQAVERFEQRANELIGQLAKNNWRRPR